jgi:DNA-binding GntR family transcriptional regulator
VRNRFVREFQKVISLIFHYHYQWDKTDERQRNEAAIREHLHWIEAMQRRDEAAAVAAAQAHLATSKQTLLSSLRGHNLG